MRIWTRRGVTVIELVVVVAIVGVLAAIGATLIPRQGHAMNQGQRIFASAVQFARFEAIKRNTVVEAVFDVGTTDVVVRGGAAVNFERRFSLDPQSSRVVVKAVDAPIMTFNARGVATSPIDRTVTIGLVGNEDFDRALSISGQGTVRSIP